MDYTNNLIQGGFFLVSRKIFSSEFWQFPPHTREIFFWLLGNVNYCDGEKLKRGQILTDYKAIQDGLKWMVGYRTERYTKWQCEIAMKLLTKATMITTTKATRKILVTILNYDTYQTPENYESHNESHKKATRKPQGTDTTSKERNKDNKENNKYIVQIFEEIWQKYPKMVGKKEALRHFTASVKTDQDIIDIKQALNNYLTSSNVQRGYIQNGSTWFNNWRDWVDYVELQIPTKTNRKAELVRNDEYNAKLRAKGFTV